MFSSAWRYMYSLNV